MEKETWLIIILAFTFAYAIIQAIEIILLKTKNDILEEIIKKQDDIIKMLKEKNKTE